MPVYEWYCDECVIKWERTLKMSDHLPKKTKCPKCSNLSERLFDQATPVIFKGGGWSDPRQNMTAYKKGYADEVSKELIASSKRRQATANQHYARMELDPKKWNENVEKSTLKKDKGSTMSPLNSDGQKVKRGNAKKITDQVYDKHGDGDSPNNPKVKIQ